MARDYIGTGGLRLTLDEPLDPEMAKQVAAGRLVAADGATADDVQAADKSLVVGHGSEANTADRVGAHTRTPGDRPGDDASAGEWATYAVALGLEATQASTLSLTQLQEWVGAHEDALGEGEPAPVPTSDPEVPAEPLPDRPAANAKVADWRAYAIALGMDPDQAKDATKADCQDYAAVVEQAREAQDQAPADDTADGGSED